MVAMHGACASHGSSILGTCADALLFAHFPQVVDEADRLLRQRYQDWLPRVLPMLPEASLPGGAAVGSGWEQPVRDVLLPFGLPR